MRVRRTETRDILTGKRESGQQAPVVSKEEGKCAAFLGCLPTYWQVTRSGACRYFKEEEGKRISVFRMPSDVLAGDAQRRVPIP